ncbi:hypothetical protein H0A70_05245 [Alcaligenaceae bacterium]|nr:hypothetical protein [Alcaligenaceae bacterium]
MPKFTLKDGVLSSQVYVQVTREHKCSCGEEMTITMSLPEGVGYRTQITINNAHCPGCGETVVIPYGHHYIENYRLLTKEP